MRAVQLHINTLSRSTTPPPIGFAADRS